MIDLYRVLGVRQSATRDQIRSAYRRLAKTAHPDVGGDQAAFERLKLAHDVLADAGRRKRYDETGEYAQAAADNALAEPLGMLAQAFDQALGELGKANARAARHDLVAMMRAALDKRATEADRQRAALQAGVEQMRAVVGRFQVDGENHLDSMVRAKIAQVEAVIATLARQAEAIERAREMLAKYLFDAESAMMVMQIFQPMWGGTTTAQI